MSKTDNNRIRKTADVLTAGLGADSVLLNEPMYLHTTFRIGGPADLFVTPKSAEETRKTIRTLRDLGVPYFILGNGSNLLVSDDGYRGCIVQIDRKMSNVTALPDGSLLAEAGAHLAGIAAKARDLGLGGMEFASGIPGTLGGACVMNAGAYGGEMKDVVTEVTSLTKDGLAYTRPVSSLSMGYRTSCFQKNEEIVLSAKIRLVSRDRAEITSRMEELKEKRVAKQPLELPSAGSTFRRPEGHFAGQLIEEAGLRGFSVGGAEVSRKHCGFIVNTGSATAEDVRVLIREVRQRVLEHSGVTLEPEVRFLGNFREEL